MCGISGIELAIIIAAAVIILGPEKLPELLRMLAKVAHQARGLTGDLQKVSRAMDRDLPRRELERLVREQVAPSGGSGVGARTPSPRKRARDADVEARIDEIRRTRAERTEGRGPETDGGDAGEGGDGFSLNPVMAGEGEAPPALPTARPAAGAVARASTGGPVPSEGLSAGRGAAGGGDAT